MEKKCKQKYISFSQKHKFTTSGLDFLCQMLELKTCTGKRDDEFFVYLSNAVITTSDEKFHKIEKLGKCDEYVYDVKTDSWF